MESHQELLVAHITDLYEKISRLEDLSPSNHVNTLFTKLVLTCLSPTDIDVTRLSERVLEMRCRLIKLCGEAEGILEGHFSNLIGSHANPLDHTSIFPYYSNYLKLTHLEFSMLKKHCTILPNRVAFIGSGPLPLTSIILATKYLMTTSFYNYDIDPYANVKAFQLVSSDPDLSKRMFFHTADIMNVSSGLKEYEVIFLAALVGMDKEEKIRVIRHLAEHMAPGAFLLLRSAHGARAFLYPVIDPCYDLQGFEVLSVFHPTDEVINSVIIARKQLNPILSWNQELDSTTLPSKCSEIQCFNPINHGNIMEELTIDEQLL
ncbi:nicotianamine synthase-like [Durio zibethinus]|uniref:Nicotianamine synthase n=1 Tax=Durio zibethinus TaxID=66656 RepID=A0A6P6A8Q2_DURZI|nr:nicotianamine synthase-like [Durio zibethinus]